MPLKTDRLRRGACVLLPTALAALLLGPSLGTGYIADDVISSLVPGMIRSSGSNFFERTIGAMRASIESGRFYPLVWIQYNAVFCLIRDVVLYKLFVVAGCLVDLLLLMALVRRVGGDRGLACLVAVLTAALFQFRAFFDPILSFHGLLQLVAALLLLSLLALQSSLNGRGRRWLVASALLYLGCLLLYEVTYPLFLLHAALIWRQRPAMRSRLAAALPFVVLAVACVGASVVVRRLFPGESYIHAVRFDPAAVALALAKQTSAALPLSYFAADPAGLFAEVRGPLAVARWIARWDVLAVAVLGAVAAGIGLRLSRADEGTPPDRRGTLAVLGLILATLPGAMIAISSRYQSEIGFGKGYLPVYLQCFGVGLLLATALRSAFDRPGRLRWPAVAVAALVGLTAGLTYRANAAVAVSLVSPPGTRHFNPVAAGMAGVSHFQRINIEAALKAGLLDEMPERATLLMANPYANWHEEPFGTFFYAMYTDRQLAPRARSAPGGGGDGGGFVLSDVCLGREAGYVLLWRAVPGDDRPGSVRLFVRHPRLRGGVPGSRFAVVGSRGGTGSVPVVRLDDEVAVVDAGRGWALYDLGGVGVDPDAIRLAFDRRTIADAVAARAASPPLADAAGPAPHR